jgi:hypothetical protein
MAIKTVFACSLILISCLACAGSGELVEWRPGMEDFSATNLTAPLALRPVPFESFSGAYSNLSTNAYPTNFHGTHTIAALKTLITAAVVAIPNYQIRAKITATTTYSGSFNKRALYIQDGTAGIYVYSPSSDITPLVQTSLGQIVTLTVSAAALYNGSPQITGFSGLAISAPVGDDPTWLAVRDISGASLDYAHTLVRYAGRISEISASGTTRTLKFVGLPQIYCEAASLANPGVDIGERVTVIGVLTRFYEAVQMDHRGGFQFLGTGLSSNLTNAVLLD